MDDASKLRFFSVGIVLFDKERGSDYIIATPQEHMSLQDGKLNEQKIEYDVLMPNRKGVLEKTVLTSNLKLKAKWIPFSDPNRLTAPDVIKNESVMIWRFADTDDYYWCSIFREPSIRRLETVCWMFGNTPKFGETWDKSTAYWMEFSTHEKTFQIHLASNDGEVTTYDIKIDARNGTAELTDGLGNSFNINSGEGMIQVKSAEEAMMTIRGRSIQFDCDEFIVNGNAINLNGGDIKFEGSAITANGEDLTIDLT